MNEAWRKVWREGFAPLHSTAGLEALAAALRSNDETLLQGKTTDPPPLLCVQDWDCRGADAVGFPGWRGDGLRAVGEVEESFARCCIDCDAALGEPAACRHFLNWWDDTPRHEAFRELLAEVESVLLTRTYEMAGVA